MSTSACWFQWLLGAYVDGSFGKGFEVTRGSVRLRAHHVQVSSLNGYLDAVKDYLRFESIGPSCGQDVLEEDTDPLLGCDSIHLNGSHSNYHERYCWK